MLWLLIGIVFLCGRVWAQEPEPEPNPQETYTIQAVTCVPGASSVSYLATQKDHVRFAPGKWLPQSGAHLRCAIPLQGKAYWNSISVLYKDPDGFNTNASIIVTLYRAQFRYATSILASVDSSNYPHIPYSASTAQAPILVPQFDFTHFAYWVDLTLIRRTELTVSPVVYAVELRYYASYDPYTGR